MSAESRPTRDSRTNRGEVATRDAARDATRVAALTKNVSLDLAGRPLPDQHARHDFIVFSTFSLFFNIFQRCFRDSTISLFSAEKVRAGKQLS